MEKEEVAVIAQLLTAMKDSAEKLEQAQRKKDLESIAEAKKEILSFQRQIKELL